MTTPPYFGTWADGVVLAVAVGAVVVVRVVGAVDVVAVVEVGGLHDAITGATSIKQLTHKHAVLLFILNLPF